jgi:hypothetical protein
MGAAITFILAANCIIQFATAPRKAESQDAPGAAASGSCRAVGRDLDLDLVKEEDSSLFLSERMASDLYHRHHRNCRVSVHVHVTLHTPPFTPRIFHNPVILATLRSITYY